MLRRRRFRLFVFLILCALRPTAAQAQDTRTDNLMYWASREMAAKNFAEATRVLQKAIKAAPRDPRPYAALADFLYGVYHFREAAAIYYQGFNEAAGGDTLLAKPLAEALLRSGQAGSAGSILSSVPARRRDARWARLAAQVRFAADALRRPAADTAVPLGPRVNTPDAETFPLAKADGSLLLFTRRVGGMDEEFFRAVPDSCGGWLTARVLPSPPNTPMMEAAQSLSTDGHYLFFTRCEQRAESGWNGGGCDLYMAYTKDGNRADSTVWSNPEPFGGTINGPDYEGMPCLSPDNRELFFASDRPGGYGGLDLYTTRFVDGLWQLPRNLGPAVNGPGDEAAPFLAADGVSLYFSSTSPVENLGGRDLYRAQRLTVGDTLWSKIQNLGPSVNSGYDELSISVHPDGRTALFATDRGGTRAGDYDVYSITLPAGIAPSPATFVHGVAYDSMSRERLTYTRLILSDASTGEKLQDVLSNRGDGSYTLVLKPRVRYAVLADRISYTEVLDTLYYDSVYTTKPAEWNVVLLRSDYEPPVLEAAVGEGLRVGPSLPRDELILRLQFEKNSVTISDSTWDVIAHALEPYAGNTSATVLVNSYTDDSGTPLLNTQLSELRARLVADVVERMGVPRDRIEAKGWADSSPMAPNDSDANRRLNRRVEVVVRNQIIESPPASSLRE